MSQNKGDLNMSNFPKINDTVRIGKGKVEYLVVNVIDLNDAGTGAVTVESKNTGKVQVVEQARITVVESAPVATETAQVSEDEEEFDVREDRRQSAYGLMILAQVMRKNPRAGAHNVNPLKPIGSKRAKVRSKVRAQRTFLRERNQSFNTLAREAGYVPKSA